MTTISDDLREGLAAIEHERCGATGCLRPPYAKGFCNPHYKRMRRYGDPMADPRRKPNNHIRDGIGYLDLGNNVFALVDIAVFETAGRYRWHLNTNGYARHAHRYLHQIIRPGSLPVDHINHDKLDNRSANLRHVTPSQNALNRDPASAVGGSGFIGVAFVPGKRRKSWRAYGSVNGRQKTVGYYHSVEEAARARAAWLEREVGESND